MQIRKKKEIGQLSRSAPELRIAPVQFLVISDDSSGKSNKHMPKSKRTFFDQFVGISIMYFFTMENPRNDHWMGEYPKGKKHYVLLSNF